MIRKPSCWATSTVGTDEAEEDADPRHRVGEEEQQGERSDEVTEAVVHPPADDEARQHQHDQDAGVVEDVGERAAAEHGRPGHRQ